MIRLLEGVVLRLLLWGGLPLLLAVLAIGPARVKRGLKFGWDWLFRRRLEPEEILSQVVEQHHQHVAKVKRALKQAEDTELEILANIEQSEKNVSELEEEARKLASRDDALGARGALYKLNLEQVALANFRQQSQRQRAMVNESRRRLYLIELQLRQYEVGRSILLSQLAEAENVERQYEIARDFDPFNAVADWQKAEGMVLEKSLNARAIERVYTDTKDVAPNNQTAQVDPAVIESQLKQLRADVERDGDSGQSAEEERDEPRSRSTKKQRERER